MRKALISLACVVAGLGGSSASAATCADAATGSTSHTPRSGMQRLRASEAHGETSPNPTLTELFVGVTRAAATLGGSTNGTWAQEFGRPRGGSAKSSYTGPQHNCPFEHLKGL